MTHSQPQARRILAIDPFVSGLGFVVLEESESLIDWGLRTVKGEKNLACLSIIEALIVRYSPSIIVVENCQVKRCRRRQRVKDLIEDIVVLAKAKRTKCRRIARLTIQKEFSQPTVFTKHQIATMLVERFPELARHLPPSRKAWMGEDARMSIFDALALAIIQQEKEQFLRPLPE